MESKPASTFELKTLRLHLIPCSLSVAQAALADKSQLEVLLPVRIPEDWPTADMQDFLPIYIQMLVADRFALGWGAWLTILTKENTLIGDLGFWGRPNEEGSVEIGYEVLPAYRHQGYAFEAVQTLVNWAFTQENVKRVIAHSLLENTASIRILEKLGMEPVEIGETPGSPEGKVGKWQLINLKSKS